MYLPILVGVACAVGFYRAAEYERMSPWAWTLGSLGLSVAISLLTHGVQFVLIGQAALFGAMWWHNARREPQR